MNPGILGLVGLAVYFIGTHVAMMLFYKPYRYWWNYYSDLAYSKNTGISRRINRVSTIFFAVTVSYTWLSIDQIITENITLITAMGLIGLLSLMGTVIFVYDKHHPMLHGVFVTAANLMLNTALFTVNLELRSPVITIHLLFFIVYFVTWSVTGRIYRYDLKKARPLHAPVQKFYVILIEFAFLAVLLRFF